MRLVAKVDDCSRNDRGDWAMGIRVYTANGKENSNELRRDLLKSLRKFHAKEKDSDDSI